MKLFNLNKNVCIKQKEKVQFCTRKERIKQNDSQLIEFCTILVVSLTNVKNPLKTPLKIGHNYKYDRHTVKTRKIISHYVTFTHLQKSDLLLGKIQIYITLESTFSIYYYVTMLVFIFL